ncbi:hypothetical protein [Roseovarius sp. EL26]|uniref:hypothetical protein n=1 Tax=Roseovarius sp. EL26 TaxID=2126672 RepID=UPI000EA031CB|nr:hypothetical protein [Roseovarius sp. EL26]
MTRSRLTSTPFKKRGFMAVLLAFVLALRIVAAPVVMAAPQPGMIALCSGGQIIYVSLESGEPVPGSETEHSDPCPFFGITAAIDSDRSDIPSLLQVALPLPREIEATQAQSVKHQALYHSRAPPLFT